MKNRYKFTFIASCFFADLLAMIVGALVFLKFAGNDPLEWDVFFRTKTIPLTLICWLISLLYFRLYQIDTLFNLKVFFSNSARALVTQRILWQSYIYIYHGGNLVYSISKSANLFQLSFLLVYFLVSRILITLILVRLKKWTCNPYTVAIWGFNKTSIELAAQLETNSHFIHFEGIVNENSAEDFKSKKDFRRALINAIHQAAEKKINEFYIVAKPNYIEELNSYFELGDRYCMRLKFVPDFSLISQFHYSASNFNNFHVIKPRNEPLQNSYNRLIKRIFDIVFSLLVLVLLLSWLYPILAFLIKKESPGPVLFKQERSGKKNNPFWCYKFRSMYINSGDETQQARKGDDRITPIGKFIRRSSIDELPQFFNVLVGNMSVVGPRPHMLQHTKEYNDQIRDFMVRHFVKPGITGRAQVSGLRGETKELSDMQQRVKSDIEYVQNWNLMNDIKICILTVFLAFKGDEKAF